MKKRTFIIIVVIIILAVLGVITKYIDGRRVATNNEPKYCIKIVSYDGNKVTYWGLGYKVTRYVAVSPKELYKNNLGAKMGSWFMNYKLSNLESIKVELLMEGKTIEITRIRDIENIIGLLKDSKYINELCEGMYTHKIEYDNETYYILEGCKEIKKGRKQAKISDKDFKDFKKIIEDYQMEDGFVYEDGGQYEFIATIIEAHDKYIIVEPEKGTNERKSSDKISMKINRTTTGINDFCVVGNKVKITYNGNIMESYPAQISAIKIELAD